MLALSTYKWTDLTKEQKKRSNRAVLALALLCAFMFGTYNAPIRATVVDPATSTTGLYIGMVIMSVTLGLIVRSGRKKKRKRIGAKAFGIAMGSGALWGTGTAFSIYCIDLLGLAVSFPVFLINVLIYVSWGLAYFKEIEKKHSWRVVLGAVLLFVGATLVVLV
jgi:glucose uptake protein GlcU